MRKSLEFGRINRWFVAVGTVLVTIDAYDAADLHDIHNQNLVSLPPCFTATSHQVVRLDADGTLAIRPVIVRLHAAGRESILVAVLLYMRCTADGT